MPAAAAPPTPSRPAPSPSPLAARRPLLLAGCGALLVALLAVAALAPLPFSVTYPGRTTDVLGESNGRPIISVTGAPVGDPAGELRMTTIAATSPEETVRLADVIAGYFASDRAVMPREAVYPVGDSTQEIREYNNAQMSRSQDTAVTAALDHLGLDAREVTVELNLANVGGPSAGLLFSLGIVDLLNGDGPGADLTDGRVIAGTGTIAADGTVGSVGGVPLKTQAARRDGATVFLVPRDECADANAEAPQGLRLLPVTSLAGAVEDLLALAEGKSVPSC